MRDDRIGPNAFQMLRMIRDGEITNTRDFLQMSRNSWFYHEAHHAFESLKRLGFIQVEDDWSVSVTEKVHEFANTFAVSLTEMSAFGRQSIVASPIFGRPRRDKSYPDLFVLMPFKDELTPVYQDHIKSVANKLGLSVSRADDFFSSGSIMRDVWEAIYSAKAIVADCTGRNPNVFYEIGIAHTLGKLVVLISQSIEDIPFDLRHLRTIIYNYTPRGVQNFEEALLATLQNEMTEVGLD